MIEFSKANDIVLNRAVPIRENEKVALNESRGRVLAVDVVADRAIPPFNRVAMDGYACRREDINNPLKVIETVPAGVFPEKPVGNNECTKVMTGCMLPEGADMVLMVEYSEEMDDGNIRCTGSGKQVGRDNFALEGEDLRPGDIVLEQGTLIRTGHIGILASMGCSNPEVRMMPRVGVIATGNEIIEPWEKPEQVQIRNSNSHQLVSQLERVGAEPVYYGIAPDTIESIDSIIKKAQNECDVILMTGGVSMGDLDLVPGILQQNDFEILFDKVAVKPGKPTTFAVNKDKVCFGLPGNPVTAFVVFEILVKPFLYKMMGLEYKEPALQLPLESDYSRKKSDREWWMPITITSSGKVQFLKYHGSGHFHALANAWGLARIPKGIQEYKKGNLVHVRPI